MLKSALTFWLVATTFLFSVWLNVVHGYEYDEHEHSEECEICILLSSLTDHLVGDSNTSVDRFLAEEHYLFVVKNCLSSAINFANPRAPPRIQNLT